MALDLVAAMNVCACERCSTTTEQPHCERAMRIHKAMLDARAIGRDLGARKERQAIRKEIGAAADQYRQRATDADRSPDADAELRSLEYDCHADGMNEACGIVVARGAATASVCQECGGRTVEFCGTGKDTQQRICSQWQEPGHLSEEEVKAKIQGVRNALMPSGRQG